MRPQTQIDFHLHRSVLDSPHACLWAPCLRWNLAGRSSGTQETLVGKICRRIESLEYCRWLPQPSDRSPCPCSSSIWSCQRSQSVAQIVESLEMTSWHRLWPQFADLQKSLYHCRVEIFFNLVSVGYDFGLSQFQSFLELWLSKIKSLFKLKNQIKII